MVESLKQRTCAQKRSAFSTLLAVVAFSASTLIGNALVATAQEPKPLWEVKEGCDSPESAYLDAESGLLFLSQISGEGSLADGKGWISKLDRTGKVISERWVEGLNAPKGLRSYKGQLWVSDIDQIVAIDIAQGKVVATIKIEGAKFLNDLAIGADGTIYVADMIGSKIYQYRDKKVDVFAEGESLESPNGLLVEGDSLVVAAWGFTTDFTTKVPGRLYKLNLKTKEKSLITPKPVGNLDGLELDGQGGYIVTDWVFGKVFRIDGQGEVKTVLSFGRTGAADHAYDPATSTLYLPLMLDNALRAFSLKEPAESPKQ